MVLDLFTHDGEDFKGAGIGIEDIPLLIAVNLNLAFMPEVYEIPPRPGFVLFTKKSIPIDGLECARANGA